MLDYLSVGFVLRPHGLKGEIKVKPLTDEERRFDSLKYLYLKDDGYKKIEVTSRRYDKGFVYLKLKGFENKESVEPEISIYGYPEIWPESPENTYYIADLLLPKPEQENTWVR